MGTRGDLLTHLWRHAINSRMDPDEWRSIVVASKSEPDAPFADAGPALERLIALGASADDIGLIRREAAYVAVFQTLYALDDPGVDGDDVLMLHEELLTSDPSGLEGRPGAAGAA